MLGEWIDALLRKMLFPRYPYGYTERERAILIADTTWQEIRQYAPEVMGIFR